MAELQKTLQMLWVVNIAAGILLLVLVAGRRNYRAFPDFSLYLVTNLTVNVCSLLAYHRWGFSSAFSWWFALGMQVVATSARALAVAELCKHLLARYRGIWGLAWRVTLGSAASVLIYCCIAAKYQWKLALISAERSLELAIAVVIVAVFLFVRYYGVEARPADRSPSLWFFPYSFFSGLNNTLLSPLPDNHLTPSNFYSILAFPSTLPLRTSL